MGIVVCNEQFYLLQCKARVADTGRTRGTLCLLNAFLVSRAQKQFLCEFLMDVNVENKVFRIENIISGCMDVCVIMILKLSLVKCLDVN